MKRTGWGRRMRPESSLRASKSTSLWAWIALGGAGMVVLAGAAIFVWRLLNPPVIPYVETEGPRMVIQVDVVNASNVRRAGKRVMEFLRERGFDVVELSTATELADSSMVIDRLGDRTSALKVATVLGIADSMVVSNLDSMLFVRASVIVGKDLRSLEPIAEP